LFAELENDHDDDHDGALPSVFFLISIERSLAGQRILSYSDPNAFL
jgi:hypothetical protein